MKAAMLESTTSYVYQMEFYVAKKAASVLMWSIVNTLGDETDNASSAWKPRLPFKSLVFSRGDVIPSASLLKTDACCAAPHPSPLTVSVQYEPTRGICGTVHIARTVRLRTRGTFINGLFFVDEK